MKDYDYGPMSLAPPDRMTDDALIRSAIAHFEFVSQRRTVRHFSDAPID